MKRNPSKITEQTVMKYKDTRICIKWHIKAIPLFAKTA